MRQIPSPSLRIRLAQLAIATLPIGQAGLAAQRISGSITGRTPLPSSIVLLEVMGSDEHLVDSVPVDAQGRFAFPQQFHAVGFYKLAVNDSDQVDIILDPKEKRVEFQLDGAVLQENVTVVRSRENTVLWKYKTISRRAQIERAGLRELKERTDPMDINALHRIDSLDAHFEAEKQSELDVIMSEAPSSYFAHIIRSDKKLMDAIPNGPSAVCDAFDWTDASLVRSSLYPRAIMAYLQGLPFDGPGGLQTGVDSLLNWAAPDTTCWRFSRSLLLRLFDQYGPDELAQHIVDRYVSGPGALLPTESRLQDLIRDRLRVAVGAPGPDVFLPDPLTGDTVLLSTIRSQYAYTALFFYSSTCDHCHQQMPGLKRIYSDLHGRGFQMIGVALDADRTEFSGTISDRGLPWPSFSELNGWGSAAAKAYAIKATPNLVLVDRQGIIVARPLDHDELRALLTRLLP